MFILTSLLQVLEKVEGIYFWEVLVHSTSKVTCPEGQGTSAGSPGFASSCFVVLGLLDLPKYPRFVC